MNNMKKPKIRFKGFTDDWEQRKVGELTNVLSASRVHKEEWAEDGIPFFRSSDVVSAFKGTENEKAFISIELYEKLAKSSGKLEQNDILITGGGSIGIPYIVPDNKPLYSKDADLIWIKHSANFDSRYLYTYFISEEFREYLASISHTGTIAHYTIEQVKDTPVRLPLIDEQRALGDFFVSLDHLITLHQRKYEKLQIIKKSMLENCFPKNGEKVPKIRFSGFTGDWEQRKLSEMVGMTYGGGTPSTANDTFWYGDIPWIQSSNVVEDELFNVDIKKHISRDGLNHSAAQLVSENSVAVVTHVGVGKLVFMPYSYTTSQDFISLGDMKCEPRFLCYALYKRLQEDLHIVQGSAIKGITKEDLMNKVISVPQITEQTKIANTLQGLDHLITLHQSELEKLQKIKKSLLERMFV